MGFFGFGDFKDKLERITKAADFEISIANRDNALTMQRHVVPRVPVATGETRDAFASPDAVGPAPGGKGGWQFGLLTAELRKKGRKARWLEYGTKGYDVGEKRQSGSDKKGRPRTRRIKKSIPARAARPFFRPGIEAARRELTRRYQIAVAHAMSLPGSANRAAGVVIARHKYGRDANSED